MNQEDAARISREREVVRGQIKEQWTRRSANALILGIIVLAAAIAAMVAVSLLPPPDHYRQAAINRVEDGGNRVVVRVTRDDQDAMHARVITMLDEHDIDHHMARNAITAPQVPGPLRARIQLLHSSVHRLSDNYRNWPPASTPAPLLERYDEGPYSVDIDIREMRPRPGAYTASAGGVAIITTALVTLLITRSDDFVHRAMMREMKRRQAAEAATQS